jgi:hypothetical protein
LKDGPLGPEAVNKTEKAKPISFQAQAMVLIANHPEWTAEELAQALDCSRAKLYRDPIVNRALKGRSGGKYRPPPSGYKSAEGDVEAYE